MNEGDRVFLKVILVFSIGTWLMVAILVLRAS